jgi:hypothetical protein
MRIPRFVLPLLVGICLGLAATAARAAVPCAGQSGPAVGDASFLDPPNDEYCTFIDVSSCGQAALRAHWELFWSSTCTIPAQVYLRTAAGGPGCFTPGGIIGTPISMDLVGANSAVVDHVSPPIDLPAASPGRFFICFKILTNGTCVDGTPMGNPHLRLDGTPDACQSYNPNAAGDLIADAHLAGNPVMWVEALPCTDGQLGPAVTQASFIDPPNDEYDTYVNLTGCTSGEPLRAHWELFWSSACTVPAQVQFRQAISATAPDGLNPPCFTPGTPVGVPVSFDLVGVAGQNVDHVSPPITNPGPGSWFVAITVKTNGTCADGTPMATPALRLDGTPDLCQSYNPNAAGDLIAHAGLSGNPVMWVEPAPITNHPPDCSAATASPNRLEKHDGKYQAIQILGVTDPDGDDVVITITGVTQDEPVSGKHGAGHTCPDAKFSGEQVSVRAERNGEKPKDGRIYVISFTASDNRGGTCSGKVSVCVPDKKKISKKDDGPDCVDSGQIYDSTGPCQQGDHDHILLSEDALGLEIDQVTSSVAEISFSVPTGGQVEVAVFDLLGRRMTTLENSSMTSGIHETSWKMDGVSKGLYFVRIKKGDEIVTRQVLKLQ